MFLKFINVSNLLDCLILKMSKNLIPPKAYRKTKRVLEKVTQEWDISSVKDPSRVRIILNEI